MNHHLLGAKGATLAGHHRRSHSHVHALNQCRKIDPRAGHAGRWSPPIPPAPRASIAEAGDKTPGRDRLASSPAEIYGLDILRDNIEDAAHNTTRFIMVARGHGPRTATARSSRPFVFRVRNVPAALYKALGGFATNGVNMTKLESYW